MEEFKPESQAEVRAKSKEYYRRLAELAAKKNATVEPVIEPPKYQHTKIGEDGKLRRRF